MVSVNFVFVHNYSLGTNWKHGVLIEICSLENRGTSYSEKLLLASPEAMVPW